MTRALSLWQPWASLVALGVKTIETRSWSTSYRGPLAIHAAAKRPRIQWSYCGEGLPGYMDHIALERYYDIQGASNDPDSYAHIWRGPLGAVVATCELVDCVPMVESVAIKDYPPVERERVLQVSPNHICVLDRGQGWGEVVGELFAHDSQLPYGDFTPGRFAWLLADIKPVDPPVPAKGHQQLWEWAT